MAQRVAMVTHSISRGMQFTTPPEPRLENFKAQKIFPGGISFTFSSSLYTLIPMVKFIKAGKVRIDPTSQRKRKRIISSDPFETDG
jgi:hypothetical protein